MRRATDVLFISLLFVALFPATAASQQTSAEAITKARAYADHYWHSSSTNQTASCSSSYRSPYSVGDYMGLPYDWGGYYTLSGFDMGLLQGMGAGSGVGTVYDCTVGVDCSGYVSQLWESGHYGTWTIQEVTREISWNQVKRGDAFNDPGNHIMLFSHYQANGNPYVYESFPPFGVMRTTSRTLSDIRAGFTPIRYLPDNDDDTATPVGTSDDPIEVVFGTAGTFRDTRDTTESFSDAYDRCQAETRETHETGPEYIYRVQLDQPGRLVINVQDDAGVNIDVHLYQELTYQDCIARNDTTIDMQVDCGTYYIVADTYYSPSAGTDYPGEYELTVDFTPGSGGCGVEPGYDPSGAPGDDCSGTARCLESLGSNLCVGLGNQSMCTLYCGSNADCQGAFSGGCCAGLEGGGGACVPSAHSNYCDSAVETDAGTPDTGVPDTAVPDTGTSTPDTGTPDTSTPEDTGSGEDTSVEPDVPESNNGSSNNDNNGATNSDNNGAANNGGSFLPDGNNENSGPPLFDDPPASSDGGDDSGCTVAPAKTANGGYLGLLFAAVLAVVLRRRA